MLENLGILFALGALFGWAFGDFTIHRAVRAVGWCKTLFVIGIFGFVGLLPFVWSEIGTYDASVFLPLLVVTGIIFLYSWTTFEAFRVGKLSVVEAVVAIELPLAVLLGVTLGREVLTTDQLILFGVTFLGILLVVLKRFTLRKSAAFVLEKGVWLAVIAAVFSALTYFYIGIYAKTLSPLFVIWVTHSLLAFGCGVYLYARGELRNFFTDLRAAHGAVFAAGILDNLAWLSYAYATSYIPISLAVTMSESYIALAALLGYVFNGETLRSHQIVGAIIAFIGAAALSTTL